jgi:hypothetical protein
MITIHNYKIPTDWEMWIITQGVRNSWESHDKSDSSFEDMEYVFTLGDNDKALCLRLIKSGADHSKFMRQMNIIIDFTAPEYFLKEFDTYKVATTCNRSSMMHTLGKEKFGKTMFSFDDIDPYDIAQIINNLNFLRDRWVDEGGKRKGPDAAYWRAMIQAVPQSWNYSSCWSGSYQTLRNMYHARKNHRLSEWRTFCSFIETLPYAEFITYAG